MQHGVHDSIPLAAAGAHGRQHASFFLPTLLRVAQYLSGQPVFNQITFSEFIFSFIVALPARPVALPQPAEHTRFHSEIRFSCRGRRVS